MKNKYKVFIKDNKITGIQVPVYFFRLKKRGNVFAECPALRIVTYGRTLEKAKAMFDDAFRLWKDTVNEDGNAIAVLRELGWQINNYKIVPAEPKISVPVHLLSSNNLSLDLHRS